MYCLRVSSFAVSRISPESVKLIKIRRKDEDNPGKAMEGSQMDGEGRSSKGLSLDALCYSFVGWVLHKINRG